MPVPGRYFGWSDGPGAQQITFRYLGGGIRDVTIGGNVVARWVPVTHGSGKVLAGSTRIRFRWRGGHRVEGMIQRGRGRRTQTRRFTAEHRFRDRVL